MSEHPGRDERLKAIAIALAEHDLSAVVCTHGHNVLLLSGYRPVTGISLALATAEPSVVLFVPEDEQELAAQGWADRVHTFDTGTLDSLRGAWDGLAELLREHVPKLAAGRIGYEAGLANVPATYVAQQSFGQLVPDLLRELLPGGTVTPADAMLKSLRMRPTAWERDRIRTACLIAARAFKEIAPILRNGLPENEAAQAFQRALSNAGGAARVDSSFYCMSGPNAARAYAAFQQTGHRPLQYGEAALVYCNAHADGYWTDLTRTYVVGEPAPLLNRMFDTVLAARVAAFGAIRPGVPAREVDRAVRTVLTEAGFGPSFKHATGHGVGFSAIDHEEWPRIHPCADEVLEEGMVFNVEPGIYIDGYGGVRDCNMVAVAADDCELLSPFHLTRDAWHIGL